MNPPLNNDVSTKENILNVTLELIKSEGFEAVTVRKIASLANVNIALVNYHFGSKQKLISEAVKVLLTSFQESFEVLDDLTLSPKERLKMFLLQYVSTIQQYPELVKRIITQGAVTFESQYEYGIFLKTMGFHKVQAILQELTGEEDAEKLMMMMTQVFGAVFLPTLMLPILQAGANVNLPPIEMQLDILIDRYFH
ncbi:TetR/AcrR family transcriptional regulator [Paenibacillus sp. MER TA 81-3]|uniref:TetR/AcrR family transcriptional regulator n=1 Tax=Paenibacillus sp. MER TA 81-3 TaxID=2939573 RepID=UPI002040052C|nr:TetR/AcrR family transcriptional regulator [Paenibacillus sp. MER TA 81-3]MCM3339718.1 TetR/AcrR family transcriptional regulator [Paenibacillus sp. MER TA 81-3]